MPSSTKCPLTAAKTVRTVTALFFAVAVACGGLGSRADAATLDPITGTVPRSASSFSISVEIDGITPTQYAAGSADPSDPAGQLAARFQFTLAGNSTPVPMSIATAYPTVATAQPIYATTLLLPQVSTDSLGNYILKYSGITFTETQAGYLKTLLTSGTLSIGASFYLGGTSTSAIASLATPSTLTVTSFVGLDLPQFQASPAIVGSMNSLTINWNPVASINVLNSSGANQTTATGQMRVYVVDGTNFGSQNLPAFLFNQSTSATATDTATSTACNYIAPTVESSNAVSQCVSCGSTTDTGHYYLDFTTISGLTGVLTQTAPVSAGTVTITSDNLVNNNPYVVFLQYDTPGGTPAGGQQCLIGIPTPNFTMTELNGAAAGRVVDFRCFIASAAYGSSLGKELRFFRKFRDHVLLQSYLGKRFVHYYYRFSPPVAAFIARHPTLQAMTRGALWLPAEILHTADPYY